MTEDAAKSATRILDTYAAYGCRLNSISVDELFRKYEQTGFLYPEKMKRLQPFWAQVRENWSRSMRGGELIHYVISAELERGAWASITSWRSTGSGWNTQHLVGTGGPLASRAAMLSSQAVRIRDQFDNSHQNWFQRSNRFANKVFGSIVSTLGPTSGWIGDYSYCDFPRSVAKTYSGSAMIRVRNCTVADKAAVCQLAAKLRSTVYVAAEELDGDDLLLDSVDDLYRKVGLRRYRRILIADSDNLDEPAGVALAYRGPLGLNFSFLENRCDLLINPNLDDENRASAVSALLATAAQHYADFAPASIPVITDQANQPHVQSFGGNYVRNYAQSIWLRDGFERWYEHVEKIYDRVVRIEGRRGDSRPASDVSFETPP